MSDMNGYGFGGGHLLHTLAHLGGGFGYGDHRRDDDHDHLAELITSNALHAGHANIQSDVSDAARDTIDSVRDAIDATNNIGNLNLQSTERNGGDIRSTVHQASGVVRDQMHVAQNQTQRDFSNVQREICEIRSELAQEFGTTRLEAAKQHAEIQLEMCKQHADLAAKMAECCCETKELVRSENAATRQLMQSNLIDDANRRTAAAERDLLLAKIQAGQGGPGNS